MAFHLPRTLNILSQVHGLYKHTHVGHTWLLSSLAYTHTGQSHDGSQSYGHSHTCGYRPLRKVPQNRLQKKNQNIFNKSQAVTDPCAPSPSSRCLQELLKKEQKSHLSCTVFPSSRVDTHMFLSPCHISLHSHTHRLGCSSLCDVPPHTLKESASIRWLFN